MSSVTAAEFVHLHNHSEYSLLDAIARSSDIVTRLGELGFDSYALTDHGVMYGALEFYLAMRKAALKPIIGCEVYVAARGLSDRDPNLDRRSRHLVLLAQNETGYVNLMKLTSVAHRDGFYYKPRIDVPLLQEHQAGLIALTACPNGVVAGPFNHEGGAAPAAQALERYLGIFGPERLFLEIQNHGMQMEADYRAWAADAAQRYGVRLVATNDCHYVRQEDARAHEIALCLRDKKTLTDPDRHSYSGPDYYIKSAGEMAALFPDHPEALANTRVVADLCNLELPLDQVHFPRFTIPVTTARSLVTWAQDNPELAQSPTAGTGSELTRIAAQVAAADPAAEYASTEGNSELFEAYLRRLTYEGARQRYGELTEKLQGRIEYELSVIVPKGFTTYFLICSDFCRYARSQGIPVGPGRGSAAGSVVAYCLEITDLDPLKYGLYFERFLNPERIELPDFDIDFCMRRRDEVISYVRQKYGDGRTAMIITFSRLKARAVLKAVGRTKSLEFQYVDKVTKEIQGLNPTIEEAIEQSSELRRLIASDQQIAELIADAQRLEGIASHYSVHAAGLVIGPDELWNFVPTQPVKDGDMLVTQYAMDTVPYTGLVKFDFLGLRNLTMIQDTAQFVHEYTGADFDPRAIADDDAETYATLQRGDGYGVFQFEAPQVKRMLIEGRPENIIDLAAINAANRPGPLQSGNTERYLQNRRAKVAGEALFPSIAEVLQPTGGVLLFQEQVLEIARQLAGYTLGEADVLRKAMGKKKVEMMEEQQRKFIAGADERGVKPSEAQAIWDMMEKFAGYGFNKAHSVCYAWIAYQTAYLKTHFPHYYMCAMLNCYMGHAEKLAQILAQCRKMHIPVLPPSVNAGEAQFTPTRDGQIIFGLAGIKGLGESAVTAIVNERRGGGQFKNLAGFLKRTRGSGVNRKVLQSLALAGAFDCLEPQRVELIRNLDNIEDFMRGPDQQIALFGAEAPPAGSVLPSREVTDRDVALLEKSAVGVFLTHHPFADHPMYEDARYLQLAALEESVLSHPAHWDDRPLNNGVVGLLTTVMVRVANTSKKTYAKARLEDPERSVSVLIWPKAYEQYRQSIAENTPVVLYGRVQLPDNVEEAEDAWDGLEIVVDRLELYRSATQRMSSPDPTEPRVEGNGNGPDRPAPDDTHLAAGPDVETDDLSHPLDFAPLKRAKPVIRYHAPPDQATGPPHAAGAADSFSPLPMPTGHVWLDVDLRQVNREQLERLAGLLQASSGELEVRLRLRDTSARVRQIKLDQRFCTSLDVVDQLKAEFPFFEIGLEPQGGETGRI